MNTTTSTNGRLSTRTTKTSKPATTAPKATKKERQIRKYVAGALGTVAVFGLATSLSHMAAAVHACWGSETSMLLAWAMAILIDAGMIASELGELVAPPKSKAKSWLRFYMTSAVTLSSALNCLAVFLHADGRYAIIGYVLGLLLPFLLLSLLRGAATLWQDQ